jgi:protein subunit release factor A
VDQRPGEIILEVTGQDLTELENEAGGHRIQRIPPTERRGRVHSSTVTVAVIDEAVHLDRKLLARSDGDFLVEWYSGTGCGGQYRNKHQNSCRLTHVPTGIIQTAQCRSRQNSLNEAKMNLIKLLDGRAGNNAMLAADRRAQVGSGMRGDKVRTYRFQDNIVKDHVTGKSAPVDRVMSGRFDLLW